MNDAVFLNLDCEASLCKRLIPQLNLIYRTYG